MSLYIPIDFKVPVVCPANTLKSTGTGLSPLVFIKAFELPKAFSKAPTSSPSDLLTCILNPSLYSPEGSNLLSRS